jgi:hypothetical protein
MRLWGAEQGRRESARGCLLDFHHGAESSRAAARHRDPHRRGQTARRNAGSGRGRGAIERRDSPFGGRTPGGWGCCRVPECCATWGRGAVTGCACGWKPQAGARGWTLQRSAVEALRPRDRHSRASDHGAAVCVFRAGLRGQVLAAIQRHRMARSPPGALYGFCRAVLLVCGQLLLAREPQAAAGLSGCGLTMASSDD